MTRTIGRLVDYVFSYASNYAECIGRVPRLSHGKSSADLDAGRPRLQPPPEPRGAHINQYSVCQVIFFVYLLRLIDFL